MHVIFNYEFDEDQRVYKTNQVSKAKLSYRPPKEEYNSSLLQASHYLLLLLKTGNLMKKVYLKLQFC